MRPPPRRLVGGKEPQVKRPLPRLVPRAFSSTPGQPSLTQACDRVTSHPPFRQSPIVRRGVSCLDAYTEIPYGWQCPVRVG